MLLLLQVWKKFLFAYTWKKIFPFDAVCQIQQFANWKWSHEWIPAV